MEQGIKALAAHTYFYLFIYFFKPEVDIKSPYSWKSPTASLRGEKPPLTEWNVWKISAFPFQLLIFFFWFFHLAVLLQFVLIILLSGSTRRNLPKVRLSGLEGDFVQRVLGCLSARSVFSKGICFNCLVLDQSSTTQTRVNQRRCNLQRPFCLLIRMLDAPPWACAFPVRTNSVEIFTESTHRCCSLTCLLHSVAFYTVLRPASSTQILIYIML